MEHMDSKKGGLRTAEHWLFPPVTNLFVLISGLPYLLTDSATLLMMAMGRQTAYVAEFGIRARWIEGGRSALSVMVVPQILLAEGYSKPLPLSMSSFGTSDLLVALYTHNDHLDQLGVMARTKAAQEGWSYEQDPDRVFPGDSFFDLALPIKPGKKTQRGKGDLVSSVYPLTSAHREVYTREQYISLFDRERNIQKIADSEWLAIVEWAAFQKEQS